MIALLASATVSVNHAALTTTDISIKPQEDASVFLNISITRLLFVCPVLQAAYFVNPSLYVLFV